MEKITKTMVENITGYSKNQVNYMKNNYPKALELMKKGLLFEKIEREEIKYELLLLPAFISLANCSASISIFIYVSFGIFYFTSLTQIFEQSPC